MYVGNLSLSTSQGQLAEAFTGMQFDVRKANVLMNDQGKSKGAGFVQFSSFEDAQKAVAHCQSQGLVLEGNRLIVQMARQ